MEINLYINKSDFNYKNKDIELITSTNVIFNENNNIINPIIKLNYNSNYLNCNYIYIPLFNSYYFVNDKNIELGKTITLFCEKDVLSSLDFSNCSCTIVRNETSITNVIDTKLPISQNEKDLLVIDFNPEITYPFVDNDYNYFLGVI